MCRAGVLQAGAPRAAAAQGRVGSQDLAEEARARLPPRSEAVERDMRLLELFSGTGSVGEVFRERGWEVVSVDICPAPGAHCDIVADILTLDPREIGQAHGRFDCIWASPPCTQYSIARTTAKTPRDLALADSLVSKAIEFVEVLNPRTFFIENPWTGMLRHREVVAGLPDPVRCDYCRYRARYRKRTAIWTNSALEGLLCSPGSRCEAWDRGHPTTAQRGNSSSVSRITMGRPDVRYSVHELHRIPRPLCEEAERRAAERSRVDD